MSNSLAVIADDDVALRRYVLMAHSCPVLSAEEESELVGRWIGERDKDAAQRLVVSHMRLVIKIAMQYKRYGLALADVVSEGVLGLVKAVKKFDPSRGARFATYAGWWVKAQIQSFVMSSWSMVKVGTTAAQRKLFFGLRSMKNKIARYHGEHFAITSSDAHLLAERFGVNKSDVVDMDQRLLSQDVSLNTPLGNDYGSDAIELQDVIHSNDGGNDFAERQLSALRVRFVRDALMSLSQREREILILRQLTEKPMTLENLGCRYKISTERVRQIQVAAIKKMRKFLASVGVPELYRV